MVDGHDGEAVPLQPKRVLEVESQHRLVGEPVDDGECLGERQGADAHGGVGVGERVDGDGARGRVDVQGDDGRGVEEHAQPRTSRNARSRRTPLHTATGAPRRAWSCGAEVRARRRRRGRRSSRRRARVLDRPEDRQRPAADGDDQSLPARGAPQVGGEVPAQLTRPDPRLRPCVRKCTHSDVDRSASRRQDRSP